MERADAERKMSELLKAIQQETPIPITPRDAERALAAILATDNLWEAVRLSHVPMRFLCAFWKQLIASGLMSTTDGKLYLTDEGREFVSGLGVSPVREGFCSACEGRGIDVCKFFREAADRFAVICRDRPEALQDYDQGYVTEATSLACIAFAWQRGDLEGRSLSCWATTT